MAKNQMNPSSTVSQMCLLVCVFTHSSVYVSKQQVVPADMTRPVTYSLPVKAEVLVSP